MLQDALMYSYIPAKDVTRARQFYEGKLGFRPSREIGGGVTYICAGGTACFLYPTLNAGTSAAQWTDYLAVGNAKVGMRVLQVASETLSTRSFHTNHLGSVSVITFSPAGREVTLAAVKAGDFFGELAAIDGQPRSASVTAISVFSTWKW